MKAVSQKTKNDFFWVENHWKQHWIDLVKDQIKRSVDRERKEL